VRSRTPEDRSTVGLTAGPTPTIKGAVAVAGGMDADRLLAEAADQLSAAYVPYSEYRVGAALLTGDGTVHTGCNVENANYSNSLHAEEVAVADAVREGHRSFEAIAVVSSERDGVTPCGMCRQTLVEFADGDVPVHCLDGEDVLTYQLGELLPNAIDPATLS